MWFKTGAARVGDGACVRLRLVVSGVGPKCGRHGQAWAGIGRLRMGRHRQAGNAAGRLAVALQ